MPSAPARFDLALVFCCSAEVREVNWYGGFHNFCIDPNRPSQRPFRGLFEHREQRAGCSGVQAADGSHCGSGPGLADARDVVDTGRQSDCVRFSRQPDRDTTGKTRGGHWLLGVPSRRRAALTHYDRNWSSVVSQVLSMLQCHRRGKHSGGSGPRMHPDI